ncbi:MAG: RNA polymerase sigma factor [Phycisphaerae bacterium]
MSLPNKNRLTALTDNELALLSASGSRAAFSEIVRRYTGPLLTFASSRSMNIYDAEDIVQETFLRAFSSINGFDETYPLKSWLFTIAYRLLVSGYRKKRPSLLTEEQTGSLLQFESNDYDWVWEEAGKMGMADFSVLWLKYKQGMSIKEIARISGKSEPATRVILHRARKRLSELLQQVDGEGNRSERVKQ